MKKQHIISTVTTFMVGVTVVLSLMGHKALAATGSIYLTPASSSVLSGNTLTLSLRINPGTTVNGVQATVNFDTAKLQYVSADLTNTAFGTQIVQSQSGGSISIARGILPPAPLASTDSLIETITFKALVGSGSSSVTLTGANATDANTSSYTDPTVGNATVNFTAPAATTCPSGQIGTPPNCTTPTPGGTSGGTSGSTSGSSSGSTSGSSSGGVKNPSPSTTPTPTPVSTTSVPTVSQTQAEFTTASLTLQSSIPTQVYVQFGLDQNTLNQQTPLSELATSHVITLQDGNLIPGETYYYVVVSKDAQGHIAQTSLQKLTTKGLTITVGVYDKDHKPLRNKTVTLHSTPMTGKTDDRGFVTFTNVVPGTHQVIYSEGNKTYQQPVSVENNVKKSGATQTAAVQNVSVVYNVAQNGAVAQRVLIGTILVVIIGAAAFVVARRKAHLIAPHGTPLSMQPVVVGDNPTISAPVSQQTTPPQAPSADAGISQQLSGIPDPNRPAPGSTVAPVDEERREQ